MFIVPNGFGMFRDWIVFILAFVQYMYTSANVSVPIHAHRHTRYCRLNCSEQCNFMQRRWEGESKGANRTVVKIYNMEWNQNKSHQNYVGLVVCNWLCNFCSQVDYRIYRPFNCVMFRCMFYVWIVKRPETVGNDGCKFTWARVESNRVEQSICD